MDPSEFISGLRREMQASLGELDEALPRLDWLDIAECRFGAIRLTPIDAAPEPRNLRRIKHAVAHRWTAVPLIDVLKEAVFHSECSSTISLMTGDPVGGQLLERLMLVLYAQVILSR